MLGLVYRIGAGFLFVAREVNSLPGDEEQINEQDGDENDAADDYVEGTEAEDAFLSLKVGWGDVVFVVVVTVIGFGHGYTLFLLGR